jgi:2-dehydropantoate 2-reductase
MAAIEGERMGPRIAILGTGANGSVFAADLIGAGHDVTCIEQWPEHVDKIRADGITIEIEEEGTFVTRVDTMLHLCEVATLTEPFDIVFLLLKAYDTRWGCELIKPHVADDGVVVGVQNGMTFDDIIDIMGADRAIGSVIEVSSTMLEPGFVERQSPHARSWFGVGTDDGEVTPRLLEVADLMRHVGEVEIVYDIRSAKWMKLVINAVELVPSAILDMSIPGASKIPRMRELMIRAGNEAIDAGLALGYEIVPIFGLDDVDPTRPHEYVRALFEKLMDDFVLETTRSTVLQDWIRGRHSEVNEIHGAVVAALPKGSATVNETMIELALQIERGERERGRSNLETLLAMLGSVAQGDTELVE